MDSRHPAILAILDLSKTLTLLIMIFFCLNYTINLNLSRNDYNYYSCQLLGCFFITFWILDVSNDFCVVKYNLPFYLFNSIPFFRTSRNTHLILERSFPVRVARLWNALPLSCKSLLPYTLKRNLLNHFSNH